MDASRTEAFCTRSCPFSSLSSSFMSKSLQSWTRNVSRNASENAWKRSNRHGRKPPVHPREPRVAAVSGFPDTAGRVPTGNPKPDVAPPCGRTENSTKAQRIGFGRKRKCGNRGKHRDGQNRGILDAAARKQEKGIGAFRANAYSQQPAVRAAARVCGFWKLTFFSRFPERFDAKFEKSRRKAPCHNGLRRRFDRKSVRFIPL